MSATWRERASVLIPLVFAAALFAPYVVRGERFFCGPTDLFPPWGPPAAHERPFDLDVTDQAVFMWPNYDHWKKSVRGDLDGLFWNPDHLCGTPFLATQDTYAFYPANFLAFLGDGTDVFGWTAFVHVAWCGLGAYLLLRRFGAGGAASALGAVAFAGGPWMVAHLDYPNFPQTSAWTPWILLGADLAAGERRRRDRALLAASTAMSLYAGMIQLTIISLVAAGLFALGRAIARARSEGFGAIPRGLFSALLGVIYGLLLGAPQLLPLFDYALQGSRMKAGLADLRPQCLPAGEWWSLLAPDLIPSAPETLAALRNGALVETTAPGDFPLARALGLRGPSTSFSESVFAPYAAGVVLALAGLRGRGALRFAGLGLIALGAGAAADTPIFAAVHGLPGTAFGSPRRWLLLAAAGFGLLAAAGAGAVREERGRRLAALFPAATLLAALATILGRERLVSSLVTHASCSAAAANAALAYVGDRLGRATACGVVAVAALYAPRRYRLLGVLLVLGVEAVLFQTAHNPGQPRAPLFPPRETMSLLRGGEPEGAPSSRRTAKLLGDRADCLAALGAPPSPHLLAANLGALFDLRDVHGYEGVLNARVAEVFTRAEPGCVLFDHRVETFSRPETPALPLFDFLGVAQVLSQRAQGLPGLPLRHIAAADRLVLLENEGALPTENLVASARVFDDDDALLSALVAPDFAPAREVLLLRRDAERLGLPPPDAAGRITLPAAAEPATILVEKRGAARLSCRVAAPGPRLMTTAEAYDPGFRFRTPEGRELPCVRGNHAFQVVFLDAGVERIERTYRPRTFVVALALAACGVLALLVDSRVRRPAAANPPDRAPSPAE